MILRLLWSVFAFLVAGANPVIAATIAESCAGFPEALIEADPKAAPAFFTDIDKQLAGDADKAGMAARNALKELAVVPANDALFYAKMEQAARLLNERQDVSGQTLPPKSLAERLMQLWATFPTPQTRTAAKDAKQDECLENSKDAPFGRYMQAMTPILKELAGLSPELKSLTKQIGTVPFLPAGMAAPFGATMGTSKTEQPRICVNPEEAPPWIAILMMHELKHAQNPDTKKYKLAFFGALKKKADRKELVAKRTTMDVERFLDELRAYAVSVHAARAMIATAPGYFCRLWMPSYQAGRPVRFPSGYAAMEQRFKSGKMAEWVALEYTIKMKRYLPDAIFVDGYEEDGLRPEVAKRADELIATLGL